MNPFLDFTAEMLLRLFSWSTEDPAAPKLLRWLGLFFFGALLAASAGFAVGFAWQAVVMGQRQDLTTCLFFLLFAVGLAGFSLLLIQALLTAVRRRRK